MIMMKRLFYLYLLLTATVFSSCILQKRTSLVPENGINSLRLLDVYEIPFNDSFRHTNIGGLSGIDYDLQTGLFYLISDDRSAWQPARFYTMRTRFSATAIDSVWFEDVVYLQQPGGSVYPSVKEAPRLTPDPEAIRYHPAKKEIVWTSEGERLVTAKDTLLQDPSIHILSSNGVFKRDIPLPQNLWMHAAEKGPRRNGVLEGMTFANRYNTLYVNLEEPRYEDGPQAALQPNEAWIRIYAFNYASGKNTAQYAYKLEPVVYAPNPPGSFMVNGIPDILDAGKNKLLVMERSFSTGRLPCTIRIFLADLQGAEDIQERNSLKEQPVQYPVRKKLLLNMDSLGIYTDNVEGMCWGPRLPNGKRTLWMIADNNFSALEKTQLFLFEVD